MQSEYSLMTRNPEIAVIETCSDLGVTFVPFSPVGRGYLSDETIVPDELHKNDLRKTFPRFSEPHLSANLSLLEKARKISSELCCSLAQLSLAWTLAQDESAIPIPGTTSLEHLSDNFESQKVELTQELLHELNEIFLPEIISGPRYSEQAQATVTTERFEFE